MNDQERVRRLEQGECIDHRFFAAECPVCERVCLQRFGLTVREFTAFEGVIVLRDGEAHPMERDDG